LFVIDEHLLVFRQELSININLFQHDLLLLTEEGALAAWAYLLLVLALEPRV
jgi:hypothetical protein